MSWRQIADRMHRTALNIRDKWRTMGGQHYRERRMAAWTIREMLDLLRRVARKAGVELVRPEAQALLEHEEAHNGQDALDQARNSRMAFTSHNHQLLKPYLIKSKMMTVQ